MTNEPSAAGVGAAIPNFSLIQRIWAFPIARILAFFGLSTLFALLMGFGLKGIIKAAPTRLYLGSEPTTLLGYVCLATATLLAYGIMVRRVDKRSRASAGLMPQGILSETGVGLLIGGGVFSAVIGMMRAVGVYHIAGVNLHFHPLIPLLLFLCLAVFQEIAVRGYLFQTLERRWGSGIALIVSSVFFGLAHLGSPVNGLTTLQWLVGPLFISFETGLLFTRVIC